MTKAELRDKIRAVVQQVYKPKSAPVDLDAPSPISLGPVKFPVLAFVSAISSEPPETPALFANVIIFLFYINYTIN